MAASHERILIVESDRETSDLIARQTLEPSGFRVEIAGDAAQALRVMPLFTPDVVLANLSLPGLSGKDFLVALSSQGIDVPVIMIAPRGLEGDVIQAFRLGASDYLATPIREAEVLSAVERALKQVRARREREQLSRQLNQTNQELQRRVRELTTIFAIGKAVTSITSQRALFEKIVEGAIYVTEADLGWLLLREERKQPFRLCASRDLPDPFSRKAGEVWEDEVTTLVGLSGESLSICGEPLKRFEIACLGEAALVVPMKVKKEVVGLLLVMRKAALPFSPSNQTLIEAVADYASISLVNAKLFQALEERAQTLQQLAEGAQIGERIKEEMIQGTSGIISSIVGISLAHLEELGKTLTGGVRVEQGESFRSLKRNYEQMAYLSEMLLTVQKVDGNKQRRLVDLSELSRQIIARFQRAAQSAGITLFAELPTKPITIHAQPGQIYRVIEGLLSQALRQSSPGGMVTARLILTKENQRNWAHLSLKNSGQGLDAGQMAHLFEPGFREKPASKYFAGCFGISLSLVREIVKNHGGKVWVDSANGKSSIFHVILPVNNPLVSNL